MPTTENRSARRVVEAVFLAVALCVLGILSTGTVAVAYGYDDPPPDRTHVVRNSARAVSDQARLLTADSGVTRPRNYDLHSNPARASARLERAGFAPNTTGGSARFVVNSAGDALDTTRIAIPEGKFGYLLDNPSKAGVFRDSLGFDRAGLEPALRGHLVENFGTATQSVPMVGGGTKFSVTGPLVGPSGQKWTITSAWGVDPNGTIRLITATP